MVLYHKISNINKTDVCQINKIQKKWKIPINKKTKKRRNKKELNMKEEEKRETTLLIRNFDEKLDFGKFPI